MPRDTQHPDQQSHLPVSGGRLDTQGTMSRPYARPYRRCPGLSTDLSKLLTTCGNVDVRGSSWTRCQNLGVKGSQVKILSARPNRRCRETALTWTYRPRCRTIRTPAGRRSGARRPCDRAGPPRPPGAPRGCGARTRASGARCATGSPARQPPGREPPEHVAVYLRPHLLASAFTTTRPVSCHASPASTGPEPVGLAVPSTEPRCRGGSPRSSPAPRGPRRDSRRRPCEAATRRGRALERSVGGTAPRGGGP